MQDDTKWISAVMFKTPILDSLEGEVIGRIDEIRTRVSYSLSTSRRWTGLLRRATLARAIQGSNSIEGYNVTLDDAIAAVEGKDPLEAKPETWLAIVGYRNAITYILQLSDDPHFTYNEGLIRGLHFMMLQHDLTKHPGKWRPGTIYVRHEPSGKIVYEGPDAGMVPELTRELIVWLNGTEDSPAMIRAAMAHLNLAMIHPFSDGNGRMGRALQTLVLAREGILAEPFCSIEEYLGRYQQAYYDVLGEVGQGAWHPERDARPWARFCLTAHFRQANTILRRTKELERLWNELEAEVKRRELPDRAMFALADAAVGRRVRNSTYRPAAEISEQLASRDLKLLVDHGLLIAEGERRGRSYRASDVLTAIRARTRDLGPRAEQEDPFLSGTISL